MIAEQDPQDTLLLRILENVPFEGWSDKALKAADPDGAETRRLFPHGVGDAVAHFADWADRQMLARLDGVDLAAFRIRDVIALLVKARLEALTPYKDAVRREATWLALRPDMAVRLLWQTADAMWRVAGDTATDLNHYSKRGLLSGVIASTTLCWLGDTSPDAGATWAFLDRRIANVMDAGKLIGKAKAFDPSRAMETLAGIAAKVRYRS